MSLYIRVMVGFYTHRKTLRLRASIGDSAFWVPPRLWAYAADNQPDGCFKDYSAEEIGMLLGYLGDAQAMLQAMLQAGFMDAEPLRIHDWEEHNGYHGTYAERARKAANARWSKQQDSDLKRPDLIVPERRQALLQAQTPKFQQPSREELLLQVSKVGLPESEADRFLNYYESNGWRVGKNPMKSWVHALNNWKIQWETNRKSSKPASKPSGGFVDKETGFFIGVKDHTWNGQP